MLVITGVFENERFIPDNPVSIPQKKKVTIIIEEHTTEASGTVKPVEFSIQERIAAAERLVGVASNNAITLEEIRNERLARQ